MLLCFIKQIVEIVNCLPMGCFYVGPDIETALGYNSVFMENINDNELIVDKRCEWQGKDQLR